MFEYLELESGMVIDVLEKGSGDVLRLLVVHIDKELHLYTQNGHWCVLTEIIDDVRSEIIGVYRYIGSHNCDMNLSPFNDKNLEIMWAKKLKVKWDEVEVDTPIVVNSGAKSLIRYFAGYDSKNNMVEYFIHGATSLSASGKCKSFATECELYEE